MLGGLDRPEVRRTPHVDGRRSPRNPLRIGTSDRAYPLEIAHSVTATRLAWPSRAASLRTPPFVCRRRSKRLICGISGCGHVDASEIHQSSERAASHAPSFLVEHCFADLVGQQRFTVDRLDREDHSDRGVPLVHYRFRAENAAAVRRGIDQRRGGSGLDRRLVSPSPVFWRRPQRRCASDPIDATTSSGAAR